MPATSSAPPTKPAGLLGSGCVAVGAPATVGSVASVLGPPADGDAPVAGSAALVGEDDAEAEGIADGVVLLGRAGAGLAGAELREGPGELGAADAVRVRVALGEGVGRAPVETTGAHSPRG